VSEQAPPPSQKAPERPGFLAFWTTLPGILTGLAALLTAAVGVFSLWHNLNANSVAAPRVNTGASVTVPSTPPRQPAASSNPAGILRQGQMSLDCGFSVSLERGQFGSSILDPDFFYTGPNCEAAGQLSINHGYMAKAQEPVDKQACVAAVTASPNTYLVLHTLSVGSWVCLETNVGHVAAIRIAGLPAPGSPQLAFMYTVWE
jgi:hypothetical protein